MVQHKNVEIIRDRVIYRFYVFSFMLHHLVISVWKVFLIFTKTEMNIKRMIN